MKTADFDYNLPLELIAQSPADPRDSCRLMVLGRERGEIEHKTFSDIVDYVQQGDVLVANKTRVLPARLLGHKTPTGAAVELLLLHARFDVDATGLTWECLARPAARLKPGATMQFGADAGAPGVSLSARVVDFSAEGQGQRVVAFAPSANMSLQDTLKELGKMPLPPYIKDYTGDPEKYQTVYAMSEERSAAAPTAGLHFTPELLERVQEKGAELHFVELEVGVDTFRTVSEERAEDHAMHTEHYTIDASVAEAVNQAKAEGRRVIAVGTTSVRTLESAWEDGLVQPKDRAKTALFLLPGSTFHVVDGLITNFHVPRSTLMMLVSAFASRDIIMNAYQEAIAHKYRMLSFGDAMFIV